MDALVPPREQLPPSSRYRVLVRLAAGGMATVYLGVQRGAGGFARPVAIKRAHPQLAFDEGHKRRILREAKIAASVRHPNVAGVLDVEEVDGELITVMEYVEAAPTLDLIAADGWTHAIACRVALDAARGIEAVHDARGADGRRLGILHRDISPQNILIGIDGVSRIADFGVAEAPFASKVTTEGHIVGKRLYMAPEYVKTGVATVESEVYSLSIVFWELLARRGLFRAAHSYEDWDARRQDIPPLEGIPRSISDVIRAGLSYEPGGRPTSVAELADRFESAVVRHGMLGSAADVADLADQVAGAATRARRALFEEAGRAEVSPEENAGARSSEPEIATVEHSREIEVERTATPQREERAERRSAPRRLALLASLVAGGALVAGGVALRKQTSSDLTPAPSPTTSALQASLSALTPREPPPIAATSASDVASHQEVTPPASAVADLSRPRPTSHRSPARPRPSSRSSSDPNKPPPNPYGE